MVIGMAEAMKVHLTAYNYTTQLIRITYNVSLDEKEHTVDRYSRF